MGAVSQPDEIPVSTWLQWALILTALSLFTVREEFDTWVILGLVLLVIFFSVRIASGSFWPAGTGLEVPVGLFVFSAAIATWISYDFSAALLQFARILAGIALFSLIAAGHPSIQNWLAAGFLAAAALLAVYWPLQHDFAASSGKFEVVDAIGRWIEANGLHFKLEGLTGPFIHPNVAAGTLALAIPFGAAFGVQGWRSRRLWISGLAVLATLLVALGLLLTGSRGTWAGFAGACLIFVLAWVQRRWFTNPATKLAFWGICLGTGWLLLAILATSIDVQSLLGTIPGPANSVQTRVDLWRQGWGLAQDYFLTGSGLGTFWMVHAFYAILLHVPFIAHAHNTFLEVWIEQGLLGALALVWGAVVVFTWYWRALDRKTIPLLGLAGLFGLASMAFHAVIDVVFYIERTLPLVGFVLGYAWLAVPARSEVEPGKMPSRKTGRLIALAGALSLVLYLALTREAQMSLLYANLGSLAQTRAELGLYDPARHDKFTVDQVRQSLDYASINGDFQKSLTFDPANQTAIKRMSMIALSRGEYAAAWEAMQSAWKANPSDIGVQLLYADAAIANGFPQEAAAALQGNPWAEMHLMGFAWMRYWNQGDFQRALDSYQAVLLLNPSNLEAQKQAEKARQKLEQ